MPYTREATQSDIKYFLNRYEGFAKKAKIFQKKYQMHKWTLEMSSFEDTCEDYNKLICTGLNSQNEPTEQISIYEKGY